MSVSVSAPVYLGRQSACPRLSVAVARARTGHRAGTRHGRGGPAGVDPAGIHVDGIRPMREVAKKTCHDTLNSKE